jgi:hypothetical protein
MMSQSYCIVIGDTWYPAVDWKRANPGKLFVGLRLDRDDGSVWVLCELAIAGKELESSVADAIEGMLSREGVDIGCFNDVVIAQARSIAQGHRLARAIVEAVAVHTQSSQGDM